MNKKIIGIVLSIILFLSTSYVVIAEEKSYDYNFYYNSFADEDIIDIISMIDYNMIYGFLVNLTSYGPRVTGSGACNLAETYIISEFESFNLDVEIYNWSYRDYEGANIEAEKKGVNKSSDEIYIICAHYDSVEGSPGADDDGSGVAVVLAAAKILSKHNFSHTIRFVLFDGEEQGLYGSRDYSNKCYVKHDNITGVLNVDMVGYAEIDTPHFNRVHIFHDSESRWLAQYSKNISLEYSDYIQINVHLAGYSSGSDHYSFWKNNFHAMFYYESSTTPYYHTSMDTIENMNIEYNVKNAKLIIATLCDLSQINDPPNIPDVPNGPSNGRIRRDQYYSTSSIDPDGDNLFYKWNWGDGNFSDWLGPYTSGEICEASYKWIDQGEYGISVKVKDEFGGESDWSEPLVVSMPRVKIFNHIQKIILSLF